MDIERLVALLGDPSGMWPVPFRVADGDVAVHPELVRLAGRLVEALEGGEAGGVARQLERVANMGVVVAGSLQRIADSLAVLAEGETRRAIAERAVARERGRRFASALGEAERRTRNLRRQYQLMSVGDPANERVAGQGDLWEGRARLLERDLAEWRVAWPELAAELDADVAVAVAGGDGEH